MCGYANNGILWIKAEQIEFEFESNLYPFCDQVVYDFFSKVRESGIESISNCSKRR